MAFCQRAEPHPPQTIRVRDADCLRKKEEKRAKRASDENRYKTVDLTFPIKFARNGGELVKRYLSRRVTQVRKRNQKIIGVRVRATQKYAKTHSGTTQKHE